MIDQLIIYELNSLLFITSFFIIYQDFKERAVFWWLYLLFFILLSFLSFYVKPVDFLERIINVVFLSIQYLVVILYYWIKNKNFRLLLDEEFGLGDALLLISLSLNLPTLFFIYLYLGGLITSLIWCFIIYLVHKKLPTIPLAGILCIVFILIKVIDYVSVNKIHYF